MGESQGLVWILLAFIGLLGLGVVFANNFDIHALTFFSGIS